MDCPNCSQPGAVRRWFKVRCPNPACPSYDMTMRGAGSAGFAVHVHPPASGPERTDEPDPNSRAVRRQVGGSGIAWILWLLAYVLFRIGQHAGSNKVVMWGLAGAVGLAAFALGRRTAAAAPTGVADQEGEEEVEDGDELEEEDERLEDSEEPFDPTGGRRLEIRYRDRLEREREFVADRTSLRRRGEHVTARVEPGGARLAFRLDRILNRADVEGAIPA